MNLLLFHIDGRDFFVAGETKHHRTRETRTGKSRWDRTKERIHTAYESIRRRFDYQENVCSGLRHANRLTLVFPSSIAKKTAANRFSAFLEQRERKHLRWLLIDGALAVLGSLLTPLPGPNVFFLYPAVRAFSHYLAYRGVRQAKCLALETISFQQESSIDRIQQQGKNLDKVEREIRELESRYDLRNLRKLLYSQ